jgi:hypothetical protein
VTGWHRPDVETAALDYLTRAVGDPVGARQIVDGLLALGREQRGESTRDPMPAVRRVIADFPFAGYGLDTDGADPAWMGDLASAIAGAVGGEGR